MTDERRIWFLPIERIEARYTGMMNDALSPLCDFVLDPGGGPREIKVGQFLDVAGTISYKSEQMALVARSFERGAVQNGDVFLVGDMFYPGIEAIRYMAELSGIDIRIAGFNYAGRADPTDFVQKLGPWADTCERGYHEALDRIFVGSKFHQGQVKSKFGVDSLVTGYIWDVDWVARVHAPGTHEKEDYVIWPHRLCKEKGVDELFFLANQCPDIDFLVTTSGSPQHHPVLDLPNVHYSSKLSKADYYAAMDAARWYISTARQETFGYTLQEAIVYGCNILVPARACYPEMVPWNNLYRSAQELIDALHRTGNYRVSEQWTRRWDKNAEVVAACLRGGLI